jgi:hypothetical protein
MRGHLAALLMFTPCSAGEVTGLATDVAVDAGLCARYGHPSERGAKVPPVLTRGNKQPLKHRRSCVENPEESTIPECANLLLCRSFRDRPPPGNCWV